MTDGGKTEISCLKGRPGVQTKLFDYFVGASDDHGRDHDAQCLCRIHVKASSNTVGWITGRSAGFSPPRMRAT